MAQVLRKIGYKATLFQSTCYTKQDPMQAIMGNLPEVEMFAGFKLGSAQNAIGSTGWDFMRGDVLAGLKTNLN